MAKEYCVESKWCGWFGGYGSETDLANRINVLGREGWTLVRTESGRHGWWWLIWRPKVLMIFERNTSA